SKVGIGAAVALNVAHASAEATIGAAHVNALGLKLEASMASDLGDKDGTNTFAATASAGAGASKVGIAGAVAINVVNVQHEATIAPNAVVVANQGGTAGDVSLTADDESSYNATALPVGGGATGKEVGIGIALALNVADDTSRAEIGSGALLTGAHDLTLMATSGQTIKAMAQEGASSSSGVAVTPWVAITIANITPTADVGSGTPLSITGAFSASAIHTGSADTEAKADAAGAKAAIGASLALNVINDTSSATT